MGIEALTRDDDGNSVVPTTEDDWRDWVSATATRNHVLDDPLLDWLRLYGADHGFVPDNQQPGYDERTDFTRFLFTQAARFEAAVIEHLKTHAEVVTISSDPSAARDLAAAEATFDAMAKGVPLIYQAVLRDPQHRVYGVPDLLVRSDYLNRIFEGTLDPEAASTGAPGLGASAWHYRVVDCKFSTLHFSAKDELANSGGSASAPAYKVQLFLYNRMLGRVQGYEPPASFLLGRRWTQGSGAKHQFGDTCMERLAPVPQEGTLAHERLIWLAASEACDWVRRVRSEGAAWHVLPEPTLPELYPETGNTQDGPWHAAKSQIAKQIDDLTLLWNVRGTARGIAHHRGVTRWTDPACTPELLGIEKDRGRVLQAILDVNRGDGPPVWPARIHEAEEEWRPVPTLEFYVDFEFVNNLADDLRDFPNTSGEPLIFMIGCGHVEDGEWRFECFVADTLDPADEAQIIDDWFAHMAAVRARLDPGGDEPRIFNWSPAEPSNLETSYNSARDRHPDKQWPPVRWFDFLGNVVRKEPVVVRGALAFGLKAMAKAMHSHGLIERVWGDGPTDGLGAMVGAWWCEDERKRLGVSLRDIDLMQEIVAYNEVDCKVMMEVVRYLRTNH